MLSLLYLALYGRYVSDTLSAARAVRVRDALNVPVPLTDKLANQHLLSLLLRRRAEMFEVPVQFFAISPDQVRRTSPWDGLRAIGAVLEGRVQRMDNPRQLVAGSHRPDLNASDMASAGLADAPLDNPAARRRKVGPARVGSPHTGPTRVGPGS
jgi:hypothetical protein